MERLLQLTDPVALKYIGDVHTQSGNKKEALLFYEQCYKLGDKSLIYTIGNLYELLGNKEKAIEWYQIGREDRQTECIDALAHIHYQSKEYELAFKLYKESANLGCNVGLYNMAVMYKKGQFVATNDLQALKYFILAHEAGDDEAINKIQEFETKSIVDFLLKLHKNYKSQKTTLTELMLRPPELGGPEYEKAKREFSSLS